VTGVCFADCNSYAFTFVNGLFLFKVGDWHFTLFFPALEFSLNQATRTQLPDTSALCSSSFSEFRIKLRLRAVGSALEALWISHPWAK
jgi:hypothetical protein